MVNLEARNLSFSYGKRPILHDVGFTVHSGELLALLGPNGAGKSTLFRCLLGLLQPQTGEVLLNGEKSAQKSPAELARHIAYIPQIHYPAFNYTALDMVLMGTAAQGKQWSLPSAASTRPPRMPSNNLEHPTCPVGASVSFLAANSSLSLSPAP